MSDPGEVKSGKRDEPELARHPIVQQVSRGAKPVAAALVQLSAKERASVFRAFRQHSPEVQSNSTITGIMQRTEMSVWQGPLPQPEILAKYNDAVPGGAERILKMAERQQEHRIALEDKVATEQLQQSRLGQKFGLTIGLAGIAAAVYLGYLGKEIAAGAVAAAAIGSLAVTFAVGKWKERSSRQAKVQ